MFTSRRVCLATVVLSSLLANCDGACAAIRFAAAFIAQEVQVTPSVASGMTRYDTKADSSTDSDGISWLLEEYRPAKAVRHISGTLNHLCTHGDLLALTIYAFAHFVYGFTHRTMVLADLQGMSVPPSSSAERGT